MKLIVIVKIFTFVLFLNKIVAKEESHQYEKVHVVKSNVCPDAKVIKEIQYVVRIACLHQCSGHSNCAGVFFQPVLKNCVLCSAKYLSTDIGNDSGYELYKLNGSTLDNLGIRSIYWLEKQLLKKSDSKNACGTNNGLLASIKTSEDNNFILRNVLVVCDESVWTSGTGLGGKADSFKWRDSSFVGDGFTNWYSAQPWHPHHGAPTCLALSYSWNFKWDDTKCTDKYYGLCVLQ